MTSVVFHLTDFDPVYGIPSPQNHVHEWIQTCNAFGVKQISIIDITTFKLGNYYRNNDYNIDLKIFESIEKCYESLNYGGCEWMFFESKESIKNYSDDIHSLQSIIHHENNVYVFGPDVGSLLTFKYDNSKMVHIESNGRYPLYAKCAAAIVLHDRYVKNGS
jgi:hypothetical protein